MKKKNFNVQSNINLETLAGGAFAEKINAALMKVAENIQDPNTDATAKRGITVNIKFTPNKTRQMVNTSISVTTKLAATEAIDTQILMGVNVKTGQIEIAEYDGQIRGQQAFFEPSLGEPEPPTEAEPLTKEERLAQLAASGLVAGRDFDPSTGELFGTAGQTADDQQTTAGRVVAIKKLI